MFQIQYQQSRGRARPGTRIRKAAIAKKNKARKIQKETEAKYKGHQKGPL